MGFIKRTISVFSLVLCLTFGTSIHANAEFVLGVGLHGSDMISDKSIQAVRELRINSIRTDMMWKRTELTKGNMTAPQIIIDYIGESAKLHIEPLIILNGTNALYDNGEKPNTQEGLAAFARFAGYGGSVFKGKVRLFEVWNEWDYPTKPTSVESYFNLVRCVAPEIKSADRNAIVLAGAATSFAMRTSWSEKLSRDNNWLERLVSMGVLNYADGISIHPYVFCDKDNRPEAWVGFVSRLSEGLKRANGGREVPLYITEMGWPTHAGACQTTPEKAGQFLVRGLLLIRTLPEVKGVWWYDLRDDGQDQGDKEHHFGLLDYNYKPKPAFNAMRDIASFIIGGKNFVRMTAPEGVILVKITLAQNKHALALWTDNDKPARITASVSYSKGDTTYLKRIGTNDVAQERIGDIISFSIDGTPKVITGLSNIQINRVVW